MVRITIWYRLANWPACPTKGTLVMLEGVRSANKGSTSVVVRVIMFSSRGGKCGRGGMKLGVETLARDYIWSQNVVIGLMKVELPGVTERNLLLRC